MLVSLLEENQKYFIRYSDLREKYANECRLIGVVPIEVISLLKIARYRGKETETEWQRCHLSQEILLTISTQDHITFWLPTKITSNGNDVFIQATIGVTNMLHMKIRGTNLLSVLSKLDLCTGLQFKNNHTSHNTNYITETVQISASEGTDSTVQIICSKNCEQIVNSTWNSTTSCCRKCQKDLSKLEQMDDIDDCEEIVLTKSDDKDMSELLKSVYPNAPENMKVLLEAQHKALTVTNPKGMRWDRKVIRICLDLWMRSRKSYKALKDSGFPRLPSGRQLQKYKNSISQTTGVQDQMFAWMYHSAEKAKIPPSGLFNYNKLLFVLT